MSKIRYIEPENLDAVILCGGLGKRLRSVIGDRPKPMAEIAGRPFLDILIGYAMTFGFRHFILCAGYKGSIIKEYYQRKKNSRVEIIVSQEKRELGTAGALKKAQRLIRSSPFLVMNGDSLCRLDLLEFIRFYTEKKASFSMGLARSGSKSGNDYGNVSIDSSDRIISFCEKAETKRNDLINSGIYLLSIDIFSMIPSGKKLSLEREVFPKIVKDRFYGYVTEEELIDIGTPDRYLAAQQTASRFFHEKK